MNNTLVACSAKRTVATTSISVGATDCWASKSRSSIRQCAASGAAIGLNNARHPMEATRDIECRTAHSRAVPERLDRSICLGDMSGFVVASSTSAEDTGPR